MRTCGGIHNKLPKALDTWPPDSITYTAGETSARTPRSYLTATQTTNLKSGVTDWSKVQFATVSNYILRQLGLQLVRLVSLLSIELCGNAVMQISLIRFAWNCSTAGLLEYCVKGAVLIFANNQLDIFKQFQYQLLRTSSPVCLCLYYNIRSQYDTK